MHWLCAGHFVNSSSSTPTITSYTFHRKVIRFQVHVIHPKPHSVRHEMRIQGVGGRREIGEGDKEIQTSSCKMSHGYAMYSVENQEKKNSGLLEGVRGKVTSSLHCFCQHWVSFFFVVNFVIH